MVEGASPSHSNTDRMVEPWLNPMDGNDNSECMGDESWQVVINASK